MKAEPDCLVCLMKQALNTTRVVTDDRAVQQEVLARLARVLPELSLEDSPAAVSQAAYDVVAEVTGVADPYASNKRETNAEALRLLPELEKLVAGSDDPLRDAVRLAVAGNMIDLGIGHKFDIQEDMWTFMDLGFVIDATEDFRDDLRPGRTLLYLGDNAGEIVFDRVLVGQLVARGLDVTFTVKSGPIINDAMMADAREAGLTDLCRVIETGSNDIGVNWRRCSDAFRGAFDAADIIVSKGQGNFESCDRQPGNIYFLLKAKCECVARELGVGFGERVFKHVADRGAAEAFGA